MLEHRVHPSSFLSRGWRTSKGFSIPLELVATIKVREQARSDDNKMTSELYMFTAGLLTIPRNSAHEIVLLWKQKESRQIAESVGKTKLSKSGSTAGEEYLTAGSGSYKP